MFVVPPMARKSTPARKPVSRATGVDFGVDPGALMDDELRDETIWVFVNLPWPHRQRAIRALRQIAATPAIERLRVIDDIDEMAGRRSA